MRGAAPREPAPPRETEGVVRPPRGAAAPAPTPTPSPGPAAPRRAPSLDEAEHRIEETLASLEARLQALAGRAGLGGRDLGAALLALLPRLGERLSGAAEMVRLLEPPERLDPFGMDPRLAERAGPLLDFLYGTWWRVEARGIERVPAEGPAIVVANRGGAVPWDALVLRHALRRDHPARRDLRPLLDDAACAIPLFGPAAIRLGAARATPENANRILGAGGLLGVFPEGSAGPRPWAERYRIQRFGRGGFTKIALRHGAPVVPCAIVGSEEAAPPVSRGGWLTERVFPAAAGLAALLRLVPAALAPLPSKWSLRFGEPIETARRGAAAADDPAAVSEITQRTREAVQAMLDEDVAARASVFL
ncbi:MAG TPA: lysophospholipid acyltransferase family protein [Anaeromyxobacteraceae bacterium]|nr:lysophospholipid acyltransferase family protein [Anaeromyxobacteraceae bacterium]